MQGIFITLEGPEGSGKSTQASVLAERLRTLGREVLVTREPGGTATGELIREILQHDRAGEPLTARAETLLFEASRAHLVDTVIAPALARGVCVICDRFVDSTTVYQGLGRGFGVEQMMDINRFAVGDTMPDVTLLLDLDVSAGFERVNSRNKETGAVHDRFEREASEFHERIRAGYLELATQFPERITRVDASGTPDDVAAAIWVALSAMVDVGTGERRTAE